MVKGTISEELDEDLSKIDTCATMKYTGMYRKGDQTNYAFKSEKRQGPNYNGSGIQDGIANFSNSTTTFSLLANNISTKQSITFQAERLSENIIRGTYVSTMPYDVGTFELRRKGRL